MTPQQIKENAPEGADAYQYAGGKALEDEA